MSGMGVGTMIGLAWAKRENEVDFKAEREKIKQELRNAARESLGDRALKDAAQALHNAVIDELALEKAGKLQTRRFSDPANVATRNDVFMTTAEGQLRRISDGQVKFSKIGADRIRTSKREVGEELSRSNGKPLVI